MASNEVVLCYDEGTKIRKKRVKVAGQTGSFNRDSDALHHGHKVQMI